MEKKVHGAEVLSAKTHNEHQEKEKNKQQLKDEVTIEREREREGGRENRQGIMIHTYTCTYMHVQHV